MAFWFLRGLSRGIVTTRFPKGALDPWTADLPTPPAFNSHRLTRTRAQALARACPSGAISVQNGDLVLDLGRCCGCGTCLEAGGDAVEASGEFLLAGRDRGEYLKRVRIAGEPGAGEQQERSDAGR